MDAVLGGLVGALLTFAGQWYLGPRIESRVRAQERWEQFVIGFADHAAGPLRSTQAAARSAWSEWSGLRQLIAKRPAGIDPARASQASEQAREAFRQRLNEWQEALQRGSWLVDRITGNYGTASDGGRAFATRWIHYSHHFHAFHAFDEGPGGTDEDWASLIEARQALDQAIVSISERIGLPTTAVQQIRAWRRRLREKPL